MYVYPYVRICMCLYIYINVCCMHSARTGYIYECVCTGYIYECIPHAHAHACIHARIHSYLGRLGSALSSERPPVLVLLRCFLSHPVLNRHLCVYVYVCVECNRDHHSEILRNDVDPLETPYTGSRLGSIQVHPFHCCPK